MKITFTLLKYYVWWVNVKTNRFPLVVYTINILFKKAFGLFTS